MKELHVHAAIDSYDVFQEAEKGKKDT